MKAYEVLGRVKKDKYKIRYTFNDLKCGYCVTGLLAEGIQHDFIWNTKYAQTVAQFISERIPTITISDSSNPTPLSNLSGVQIENLSKEQAVELFKEGIRQNNGKTTIRDLILLNDYTDVTFDDFEQIFREFDI